MAIYLEGLLHYSQSIPVTSGDVAL